MNKKLTTKKKLAILRWIRVGVQIIFFILAPALYSQAFTGIKEAAATIGSGDVLAITTFTEKLFILCAVTVVCGRIFCGWACAFGALGDWVYQISQFIQAKCKKKLPAIPEKALHVLQKLKYAVLIAVILLCYLGKGSLITEYSPWTVFSLITARNFNISPYMISLVLMILIIIGMAFQERFFCQILCPMGAVFSLLPHLPTLITKRDAKECKPGCKACRKSCPVSIKLKEDSIIDGECISCGRCKLVCPRRNKKKA